MIKTKTKPTSVQPQIRAKGTLYWLPPTCKKLRANCPHGWRVGCDYRSGSDTNSERQSGFPISKANVNSNSLFRNVHEQSLVLRYPGLYKIISDEVRRERKPQTWKPWGSWTQENRLQASLMVQWLRLGMPDAGGTGVIPGQGTRSHRPQLRIPQAATETSAWLGKWINIQRKEYFSLSKF